MLFCPPGQAGNQRCPGYARLGVGVWERRSGLSRQASPLSWLWVSGPTRKRRPSMSPTCRNDRTLQLVRGVVVPSLDTIGWGGKTSPSWQPSTGLNSRGIVTSFKIHAPARSSASAGCGQGAPEQRPRSIPITPHRRGRLD